MVFGSFEASRQACRKQKNTVKTSVSAITKRRKSVRKRVQKLKNPPPGQATCGTAKKDVANQKIEVKQLKNTVFFHFSLAEFWTGAFTNRCLSYCFLQCFLRRARRPIKNRRFWAKNATPPRTREKHVLCGARSFPCKNSKFGSREFQTQS